jgi:hypothetical protein
MEFNYLTFGYLFLRLAPFILVSFFCLFSIFNKDFKGIVYLVGLIFACFINVFVGNSLDLGGGATSNAVCGVFSLGEQQLSPLPLSQTVFGYTFMYLAYVILNTGTVFDNLPTMLFFPVLICVDWLWNLFNSCHGVVSLALSTSIGLIVGLCWALVVSSANSPDLLFFMGSQHSEPVCSKPSNQTFRCNVYKNGQLISQL